VKKSVRIPVAVKLSPFFSCLAGLAQKLDVLGVDGLILFNRFYQPDVDLETLEVNPTLRLSDPCELPLRLRWVAVLSGSIRASLAVTGGVHSGADAAKAILTGADAVQVVSALMHNGPEHLARIRKDLEQTLERAGFSSLEEARGRLNYQHYPDPGSFERANYVKVLQSRKY
jgi:dihydroorotate dehydrogenase (fumarate)